MNTENPESEKHPWLKYFTIMGMVFGVGNGILLGLFADSNYPIARPLLLGCGLLLLVGGVRALRVYPHWQRASALDKGLAWPVILAGVPQGVALIAALALATPVVFLILMAELPPWWWWWIPWRD